MPPENERPVFFDSSGRRRRRFSLAVAAFVLLLILAGAAFIASIVSVPRQQQVPFEMEQAQPRASGDPLVRMVHGVRSGFRHALGTAGWLMPGRGRHAAAQPLVVGFHAPWDDSSAASLARHVDELDWLVPAWISVTGPDHKLTLFRDPRGRAIINGAQHRPKLIPMVQNAIEGQWDGQGAARLLNDPVARKTLLDRLELLLDANNARGVTFDFENLPASAQRDYLRFLGEARRRFAPHGWIIAVAVPVENPEWNLKAYAAVADKLFLMAYDEHYPGGEPGPIASQKWFVNAVSRASHGLPADKLIVALGSYAYDWASDGSTDAASVEQGWLTAKESSAMPVFDKASGNSGFTYEEAGKVHRLWMLDAASFYNQLAAIQAAGLNGVALWRMGTEDPSIWSFFGRHHRQRAPASSIERIPAGTEVDIEGSGEILRIGARPVPGIRQVTTDAKGLIVDQRFSQLPLPYVIQRTGYRPGKVALTFDDGPDPEWTPKILDILKARHAPATFFIIGENGLTNRSLLERLVAEGHEVGNHTYTHPNLGGATARETALELNATQRLFQAFTGHSLRLFRAPYFGDAEPTTADEIEPAFHAQQQGYVSVGLHVDPGDWKRPGVQAIVDRTVQGVLASDEERSGNVVLLHDAGGNRAQTVAALPLIIDQLRAKGYQFVRVSDLMHLPANAVMPPITKADRLVAKADLAMFSTLGWIVVGIGWLFAFAITIGILRAVLLSALALWQARRESRTVFPAIDPARFVSVLIPAFNEARVIERSVRQVLASGDVQLEVIVIDDGSADGTSEVVERAFGDDPRVKLVTLDNGGKARALNHGLRLARGEIVVALDADTQFEPATIARLARWFADPAIGAVAGNAKVGNRVNLVTRWQALEYITAQNLERRALALLDAMTVVPGAVGAWRKATLLEAGGYPADTLAEDQDLTIAIQRAGWKVHYDQYAIAWTEAPESFRALARQRFRWAFGTLQCLWKHRGAMATGQPRGLARIGLPQAMLFQILFAAVSPVIDLALLISIFATWAHVHEHGWAQAQTDVDKMLTYWLVFTLIDLLAGVIAFALERRERWRLLWLMIPQRIGYRQIMYYVVVKALVQAARGLRVGWGKLERSGRVAPG